MAPRRSHKKSRAGCQRCKTRRIKCDEIHPSCGNCLKHAVTCDFQQREASPASPASLSSSTTPTPASVSSITSTPEPTPSTPKTQPSPPQPVEPPASPSAPPVRFPSQSLNLSDLYLMHNWTLHTSLTISNRLDNQILWRTKIPLLASTTPFLMHSLLSISALHLHDTTSLPEYTSLAAHHHALAITQLTQTLPSISPSNCDALVVTSCLVVVYTFVSSRLDASSSGIASWVPLLRGVHSILQQAWVWVASGPLASLIRQYELTPPSTPLDTEIETVLSSLYLLCTDRTLPGSEELDDTAVSTAYFTAIAELRKSFASMSEWEEVVGGVFVWPITASDMFVKLLGERRERALIVFVHYVALFSLVDEFWWSRGSAMWELRRVEGWLGPEWLRWVEWPKRRIEGGDVGRKIGMRERGGSRGSVNAEGIMGGLLGVEDCVAGKRDGGEEGERGQ